MYYKELIAQMKREDWAADFSVTDADEAYVAVAAVESAGDAIEVSELVDFMQQRGYELRYSIPDNREFQFLLEGSA